MLVFTKKLVLKCVHYLLIYLAYLIKIKSILQETRFYPILFPTWEVRDSCSSVRSSAFCCSRLRVSVRSTPMSISVALGIQETEDECRVEPVYGPSWQRPRVLTDIVLVLSLPRPKILAYPGARPCRWSPRSQDPLWDPCEKSWLVAGLMFPLEKRHVFLLTTPKIK